MHVLTSHGISTITVPDELPGLLRDFTKDVIRAQPEDLVHYAAAYFSALAGISNAAVDGPAAAVAEQPLHPNRDLTAASCRPHSVLAHDLLPARLQLDDANTAATTAFQLDRSKSLQQHSRANSVGDGELNPIKDVAAEVDIASAAAWGVSGAGDVLAGLTPPSQLYASRRTSDGQLPAARSSAAEEPYGNTSTGDETPSPALQNEAALVADAADGGSAGVAASAVLDHEVADPAAGCMEPAVNQEDVALVALAERLFKEADANSSGGLDRKEFRNVMRSMELGLSTAQVRALMAEADENEDGCVDWREFLPAFLPLLRSAQAAQQVAAEQEEGVRGRATAMLQADMPQEALEALMLDIFRGADTDGSGALSRKEFKACLSSDMAAGLKLSRQDINTLLTEVDADGNGLVDYEEFIPVAFNILVERLKVSLLAEDAGTIEQKGLRN